MKRISVVGTSGSGKTTFAGRLAGILRVPHIELDALYWEANWVEAPTEVFRSRVREAVSADCWVVDGNYSTKARDLVWDRADTVIWLDYSFPVIFSRITRRTFRRLALREECCNGNTEKWSLTFSRDSIILWALQTYRRHRTNYPPLLRSLEQQGVRTITLRSPKEADGWLERLSSEGLKL